MLLVVHKDADDNSLSNCESKSLELVTKGIKIMFRLLWVVIFLTIFYIPNYDMYRSAYALLFHPDLHEKLYTFV